MRAPSCGERPFPSRLAPVRAGARRAASMAAAAAVGGVGVGVGAASASGCLRGCRGSPVRCEGVRGCAVCASCRPVPACNFVPWLRACIGRFLVLFWFFLFLVFFCFFLILICFPVAECF